MENLNMFQVLGFGLLLLTGSLIIICIFVYAILKIGYYLEDKQEQKYRR